MKKLDECDKAIIFGGSFDPPHLAHVHLPELARQAIGADVIVYIPAAISPLKPDRVLVDPAHRLEMLRLALRDREHAVILTDELDRAADGRPSYTVETLEALHARYPHLHMRLLIGADQLAQFDRWRNPQRIIELAEPLVMVRPPATRESVLDMLPTGYSHDEWRNRLIDLPLMDISATEARRRIAQGEPTDDLLDPAVAAYIAKHHLYSPSPSGRGQG